MNEIQPVSISSATDTPNISRLIYTIRNQQVMLASDLAMLYQVETRVLNQAVKRNQKRFPERYCFQLTKEEAELDITICDVKFRTWREASPSLRLYRTGHSYAVSNSPQ